MQIKTGGAGGGGGYLIAHLLTTNRELKYLNVEQASSLPADPTNRLILYLKTVYRQYIVNLLNIIQLNTKIIIAYMKREQM